MKKHKIDSMSRKAPFFFPTYLWDESRAGGQLKFEYFKAYLLSNEVAVVLPDLKDKEMLGKPDGLTINLWFFWRFLRLPRGTVIIQDFIFSFEFFLANWLLRILRKKVIILVFVNETKFNEPPGFSKIKNKIISYLFLQSANYIITTSKYISKEILSMGAPLNKVKLLYRPGRKIDYIANRISHKDYTNGINILCLSNIIPKKGQKYIIEALNLLNGYKPKVILAGVCKDEEYMRELRTLIKEYELEEQVKIVGWLDEQSVIEAYQNAHIVVMPSLYEPMGAVIQEAMWFGVPIVATNVGGIPEQVTHEKEALLVPPADPKSLADAIIRLIEDENLRKQLVKNSLNRVKGMSTWDSFFDEIYGMIVNNND